MSELTTVEILAIKREPALVTCDQTERLCTALLTDRERVEELLEQLPDGMKDCTIIFKECEKGHGRLTAKNWGQHECQTCENAALRAKLEKAEAEAAAKQNILDAIECNAAAAMCECVGCEIYTLAHGSDECANKTCPVMLQGIELAKKHAAKHQAMEDWIKQGAVHTETCDVLRGLKCDCGLEALREK